MKISGLIPASGGPAEATDALFNKVMLLLKASGNDGADNSTFTDSSTGAHTVTASGNSHQGSFSPFQPNGWGIHTGDNHNGNYASCTLGTTIGTGDFTLEFWFKKEIGHASYILPIGMDAGYVGVIDDEFVWNFDALEKRVTITNGRPDDGVWYHYVMQRVSGTIYVGIDGVQQGNVAHAASIGTSFGINLYNTGEFADVGILSNVRLTTTTVYGTSSYTVPTTALTAITNTLVLCCQSSRLMDESSNALAFTIAGELPVVAGGPFLSTVSYNPAVHGGSVTLDGTGDYLSMSDHANFTQDDDYTFDAWVYPTAAGGSGGTSHSVYSHHLGTGNQRSFNVRQESGIWYVALSTNGTAQTDLDGTSTPVLDAWTHLRVTFDGTTHRLWVNGVHEGSAVLGSLHNSTEDAYIGGGGGVDAFQGDIGEVHLIVGTALSTGSGDITVPTAPATIHANTKLLVRMAGAGIWDATCRSNITLAGNAQVDTAQILYDDGSLLIDGAADYALTGASNALPIRAQDFTIECIIRPITIDGAAGQGIVEMRDASNTSAPLLYCAGAPITLHAAAATRITGASLIAGTRYHIAVCRSGGTTKMFLDGTQTGSDYTDANVYTIRADAIQIGDLYAGSSEMEANIEAIRVTYAARYTTTFTPPDTFLPTRGAE